MSDRERGPQQPVVRSDADGTGEVPAHVLTLDTVFDVVSHPRRRYVVYALQFDGTWHLDDLAADLAKWEADRDGGIVQEGDAWRAYLALYHTHVPKLADLGAVAFDHEREVVSEGRNADCVRAALAGIGDALDGFRTRNESESVAEVDER